MKAGEVKRLERERGSLKSKTSSPEEVSATKTKIADLQNAVIAKNKELEGLRTKRSDLKRKENSIVLKRNMLKLHCERLASKGSGGGKTQSTQERNEEFDDVIAKEASMAKRLQGQKDDSVKKLEIVKKDIGALQKNLKDLEEKEEGLRSSGTGLKSKLNEVSDGMFTTYDALKAHREAGQTSSIEFGREKRNLSAVSQQIFSRCKPSTLFGLRNAEKLVGDPENKIGGFRGTVLQNFSVDKTFATAVETMGKQALFQLIFDDDQQASKLSNLFNAKGCNGSFRCIPVNSTTRLMSVRSRPQIAALESLPVGCFRLMDVITPASADLAPVFQMLFGNVLVCQDLETAGAMSKRYSCDCVTFDGDKVERKGAVTGGYRSRDQIALPLLQADYALREQEIAKLASGLEKQKKGEDEAARKYADLEKQKNKLQEQLVANAAEISSNKSRRTELSNRLGHAQRQKEALEAAIAEYDGRIRLSEETRKAHLEMKSSSAWRSPASAGDVKELEEKRAELAEREQELASLKAETASLESQLHGLSSEINSSLKPQIEDLTEKLSEMQTNVGSDSLISEKTTALKIANEQHARFQREFESYGPRINPMQAKHEEAQKEATEARKAFEVARKALAKKDDTAYGSTERVFAAERDSLQMSIGELEYTPYPEECEPWSHLNEEGLYEEIDAIAVKIKDLGPVNEAVLDEYADLKEEVTDLQQRGATLKTDKAAILKAMDSFRARKEEMLARTFKQIRSRFKEVFSQLMIHQPGFSAELDPIYKSGKSSSFSDVEGVDFEVSCTGGSSDKRALSGGQSSVASLALIFSIQAIDLIEDVEGREVDAWLDPEIRLSLAKMIEQRAHPNEKATPTQFIVVTHRSELASISDKIWHVEYRARESWFSEVTIERALRMLGMEGAKKTLPSSDSEDAAGTSESDSDAVSAPPGKKPKKDEPKRTRKQ
eukprot:NODE_53_length_3042_cov_26.841965_g41_i0.p1 GENE.NODE_53_length_3042_cov_26.841965_g41_i0~~NODE_53_length_3042_cov_26.841965_g41_i0.p1  ORF type:complete len:973 (+),score=379.47 NODE_53_length_3042_cov_26.841965_g41_i0:74-2920(+)